MPEQRVSIQAHERLGQSLDLTVADRDLSPGAYCSPTRFVGANVAEWTPVD